MAKAKQNSAGGGWAFALGALIGAAVGGVAALWFSPQSGAETRHEIQERTEGLAAQARERVEGPPLDRLLTEAKAAAREHRDAVG